MYQHVKHFFQKYKTQILYFFFLFCLSSVSFWRELFFTFTKDDWKLFWSAYYHNHLHFVYWLHPATQVEVFLFSRLFGYMPFLWMLFGLFVRVGTAYILSLLVKELTKSQKAGFLAGTFYASTYAGLESIGFVSAHVASIATCFACLSVYYYILYLKGNEMAKRRFVIWYGVAFLSDPGRIFIAVLIFPLLYIFLKQKIPSSIRKKWKIYLVIGSGILLLSLISFVTVLRDALLLKLFLKAFHDPSFILSKMYLLGNYFAAIGNLIIGWIIPVAQDEQNTGLYNKSIARIGVLFFLSILSVTFYSLKYRKKKLGIISFFSLWIFFFYFPNWLFEPRAPMSGAHRYHTLSSVGFVGLVAYAVALIRKKWIVWVLSILFIVSNIFMANKILAFQATFRDKSVVENLWGQVLRDVPPINGKYIFVFTGKQPFLSQSIGLGGIYFYSLTRNISDENDVPVMSSDLSTLLQDLCAHNSPYKLSRLYAWDVKDNKTLLNYSMKERTALKTKATKINCHL